ncbi:hypothetical protein Hypma_015494 [Hypsizygus marmoreus]|uniref:Uncharacterized protein n=1 Tax=Hypsizygus marmoreus TaxID=39966 RepID=A0A369K5F5_HYPMA|nr:hypothetical protein Hypma_015494 [Hypsizygus marmoreus]
MRPSLWLLVLPALAAAQSTNSSSPSPTVFTSTSLSTFLTLGPSRQISTVTSAIVTVITQTANPSPSSNSTASGNNTASSTSAGNSSASATTTTTPKNLPTAATTINGGGGSNGAPLPGATGAGGAYGPDDGYIAAASSLRRNTALVGLGGLVVGAALMMF